ncbi:MAG: hypothetical protein AB1921_07580, partial [Thermodesulfobacteriota bacterium]
RPETRCAFVLDFEFLLLLAFSWFFRMLWLRWLLLLNVRSGILGVSVRRGQSFWNQEASKFPASQSINSFLLSPATWFDTCSY